MDPATTTRTLTAIAGPALSRYHPAGVIRLGSPEDRAEAYRRLLNARATFFFDRMLAAARDDIRRRANQEEPFGLDAWMDGLKPRLTELHSALDAVRLCAPGYVIAKAEQMTYSIPISQTGDKLFKARDRHLADLAAFLDAARHDLNYTPRRW